jgi:DNA/RNA-binding domain of Phe-tRNA-synthetase-like protein
MIPIQIDPSWPAGARMGFVEARGLPALERHPELEARRLELERTLRARHQGQDRKALAALPAMAAFAAHYRPFGQTYHLLAQLESVALKGKSIPSRSCAVTALFMAELKHGVLAAAHDLVRLAGPLRMTAAQAGESYTTLGGRPATTQPGDLVLRHGLGVLSSVLQGPDQDTPVGPGTRDVLYTFYAPAELPEADLAAALDELEACLAAFAPEAGRERQILPGPKNIE